MKLTTAISSFALALLVAACASSPKTTHVEWETLGNNSDENGAYYVERFTVSGDLDFDRLAFNQFTRPMEAVNPADTVIELIPGYFCVASPRFKDAKTDTIIVDIKVRDELRSICYAPDGIHIVKADGTVLPADFVLKSMTERPEQYATATLDRMPKGDEIYAFNESIRGEIPGEFEVIPSFKNVRMLDGESEVAELKIIEQALPESDSEEYKITINNNQVLVEAAPSFMKNARRRAETLISNFSGETITNAEITDRPDFKYRGVMIDISRNFQTPDELKRVLDMLARYGFNHLHFHFSDDDAWRLDIPALPELVEVGARRGYTVDEKEFLGQIHAGDGNPESTKGTANGYYTEDEFIDLLKYADSLGIKVLPEVESPGHARAAIKAMEKRYRVTGDPSLRLIEDGDSSVYTSAQTFHDNIVNPALESTYKFFETVYDAIIDMYAKAEVELPAIHIGGDEVPWGAWSGTPSVIKYKAENNIANDHDMHGVFNRRVSDYLKSKGVKVSGWQEVVCFRNGEYNDAVAPNTYSVNSWTQSMTSPDAPSRQALDGNYPLILSNVNRFYLDMNASYHPDERGLTWSTPVDEFVSLGGYPEDLVVLQPGDRDKIYGLSGQLFSETVRSAEDMEMRLLPKILGLAERAWNSTPTYNNKGFNSVISFREIPAWEKAGYNYHLRQPGVKIEDGLVYMNAPYFDKGEIRYTLDGSAPIAQSTLYTEEFKLPADAKQIRAAYFLNGKQSVATIVWL